MLDGPDARHTSGVGKDVAGGQHGIPRNGMGETVDIAHLGQQPSQQVRNVAVNARRKRPVALKLVLDAEQPTAERLESMPSEVADQRPFFSVVMPVYDRTTELRLAIDSVLRQSISDWELLIVLDGSPPETRSVVQSYSGDKRVRVFSYDQSSGNACRGRNRGIIEARGQYVALLDSDDIALPHRLATTRAVIDATGADVVAGCALYQRSGARTANVPATGARSHTVPLSLGCLFRVNPFVTSCMAVSRAAMLIHGGFRPAMRYREDQELWMRLYARRCRFHFSPEVVGIYRIHDGNLEPTINDHPEYWARAVKTEYRLPFSDWGL